MGTSRAKTPQGNNNMVPDHFVFVLVRLAIWGPAGQCGRPKLYVKAADTANRAPKKNSPSGWKSRKTHAERALVMMSDKAVANCRRMLSAYLSTTATSSPLQARVQTKITTLQEKPCKKPPSSMREPSVT